MNKNILIVEISGKRPGNIDKRPTEKIKFKYDHLIISNNSDNYETDWQIVNVPESYQKWYIENIKNSDGAWYAPMNRSYAIKYAKEHGYKYLIQLDDNILNLQIAYMIDKSEGNLKIKKMYRATASSGSENINEMANDFVDMLTLLLKNTNCGMAGMNLSGAAVPGDCLFREGYVYSFFALKLDKVPEVFHGDFEDDIEYRLKLEQMNVPTIQCAIMGYNKVSQHATGDKTGCRAEYDKVGIKRGEHMRKLYGDIYSAGLSNRTPAAGKGAKKTSESHFRHKIKNKKIGILIYNKNEVIQTVKYLLGKWARERANTLKIEESEERQ